MTRKKRTHSRYGKGSVYKDHSRDKWVVEYRPPHTGKVIKRRVNTEEEAEELLIELRRQHQRRLNLNERNVTLADWLQYWLDEIVEPYRKHKTTDSYRQICRLYITPYLGRKRLDQLTTVDIQIFLNQLCKEVSESTAHNAYLRLQTALAVAVRQKRLPDNPARDVEKPRVTRRTIKPLRIEQCIKLLDTVKGHRLAPFYETALLTGMRQGELLGLRWNDIDFDNHTIHIRNQVQYVNGQIVQTTPKTKRGDRIIPLDDDHAEVLKRHWQYQQDERHFLGTAWKEHGFVFASEVGTPLHPRNVTRHFKALLKRADLPDIRFHDLRHTAVSLMLKGKNKSYKEISEIVGHSSIAVTMDIYGHIDKEDKARVLSALAETLNIRGRK